MSVPELIRKVDRPKNTVVVDTGNEGVFRYAVRERAESVYLPNKNPQPRNGKIIGHIIEGKYVAKREKTANAGPAFLSYGSSRLIRDLSDDVLSDLLAVYPADEAMRILVIASMRIIRPDIPLRKIAERYNRTFFSHWYPNLALSENTIGSLLHKIGEDFGKREAFLRLRIKSVAKEHHIAIDGTLKQDTSIINDLSSYSHKSNIKGCRDVSVLYAYDIERKEPICAEVFRGNFIDATSYRQFITHNNIDKGIIVADKGFPPSKIADELHKHPDLHFLTPVKRNDYRIAKNNMLEWDGKLDDVANRVLYKKSCIKGGRYLYAFKDIGKAHGEENSYIDKINEKKPFSSADLDSTLDKAGVIVFESDLDASPLAIYQCYERRWLLELVFRSYKNNICLYKTRVQNDFSLIGSEFVNFIATLITARIIKKMEDSEILKKMTYGDIMDDLTESWRKADAPEDASSGDGCWLNVSEGVYSELETLGLSKPVPKPAPKKRGRPRKKPIPAPDAPKKKRGRPPKKQA